jgi:hypothetical protein
MGGVGVVDVELDALQRAGLAVDVACGERDRASGARRHELHEAVGVVGVDVLFDVEAGLLDIEDLSAVDV